jgi:ATP-dependent Zn protease
MVASCPCIQTLKRDSGAAGFSGAELANVVNEAALLAARRGLDHVSLKELVEGLGRTRFGVDGRSQSVGSPFNAMRNWLLSSLVTPAKALGTAA